MNKKCCARSRLLDLNSMAGGATERTGRKGSHAASSIGRERIVTLAPANSETSQPGKAMLISKNINTAINRQIGYEFSAMLQYVAIGSHFIGESLHQLAAYFYR